MIYALYFISNLASAVPNLTKHGSPHKIGPDDFLHISIYGYEDLETEPRVSANNRIIFKDSEKSIEPIKIRQGDLLYMLKTLNVLCYRYHS